MINLWRYTEATGWRFMRRYRVDMADVYLGIWRTTEPTARFKLSSAKPR